MVEIVFRYRDEMSHGEWREQTCQVSSVEECIRIYGLEEDPTLYEYEIISVKPNKDKSE